MLRCGCGMMIECEVKTGQTVESIEHTRREEGQFVGIKVQMEDGLRKDVCGINGTNRKERLLSPLNTPEGREVSLLERKSKMEDD